MNPDFQIDEVKCYNVDNMELMKSKPDNFYDLGIVDPEYGNNASKPSLKPNTVKQKNGKMLNIKQSNYTHKNWDSKPAPKKYFDELLRVCKNVIIWGVNYYDYPLIGGRIVWDKLNHSSDQFDCEIAYCSLNKRTDIVRFMWSGMMQGITASNSIKEANIQQGNKKLNETRIHPTQKPVALYKWLLTKYAKEGDKILDTHGGSMTHARACLDMHFDLDICELDKEYFDKAVEGLKNNDQLYLF